jgi:tRNA (Thr-GGU) A37 N-methylase
VGAAALRSPARPSPIAISVVKLDCLNGTPLLDSKPYFVSVDGVPKATVGWHNKSSG